MELCTCCCEIRLFVILGAGYLQVLGVANCWLRLVADDPFANIDWFGGSKSSAPATTTQDVWGAEGPAANSHDDVWSSVPGWCNHQNRCMLFWSNVHCCLVIKTGPFNLLV